MRKQLQRPHVKFKSVAAPTYSLAPGTPRKVIKSALDLSVRVKTQMTAVTLFSEFAQSNIESVVHASDDCGAAIVALSDELKALQQAKKALAHETVLLTEKTSAHGFLNLAIEVAIREKELAAVDPGIDSGYDDLTKDLDGQVAAVSSSLTVAKDNRQKLTRAAGDAVLASLSKCQDMGAAIKFLRRHGDRWLTHLDLPAGVTAIGVATRHLGGAGEVTPGSDLGAWNANVLVLMARDAVTNVARLRKSQRSIPR